MSHSPALQGRGRFTDAHEPLLPAQGLAATPMWGLGAFFFVLVLSLSLLLADVVMGWPTYPPAWQLQLAAALVLLAAAGCLESHLICLQKRVRHQGYLGVYRRLKRLSRFPLFITAAGTACLLVVVVGCYEWRLEPHWTVRLVLGAEGLALGLVLAWYTAVLRSGQHDDSGPDVAAWLRSPLHPSAPLQQHTQHAEGATGLVECPAEVLRFQEERLHHLGQEVLRLQDALAAGGVRVPVAGGANTQEDLEYWLALREQELRTLAAERDVLASEVRRVRAVLSEREAELAHLRSSTKQYAEENARLRAIRDEWSARSAKLEQQILKLQADTGIKPGE